MIQLLQQAQMGKPRSPTKGVALFIDDNSEALGISFCRSRNSKHIVISPGLASLNWTRALKER